MPHRPLWKLLSAYESKGDLFQMERLLLISAMASGPIFLPVSGLLLKIFQRRLNEDVIKVLFGCTNQSTLL